MSNTEPVQSLPDVEPISVLKAEAWVLRAPCEVPVRTSFGTMHDRPAVFLRLTGDDGSIGLGEVWCNFPTCGAEHRANLLETAIFPALLEGGPETPGRCFRRLDARFKRLAIQAGEAGPIAHSLAGVDLALWDMAARRLGRPLWQVLAGESGRIGCYASGINPTGAAETAFRCRDQGYGAFKLKIGFGDDTDFANLDAIRAAMDEGEALMVDVNQGWTLAETLERLPRLSGYGLSWLEEPILADRPVAEWRELAGASTVPLAAGENIMGEEAFEDALAGDWLAVVQPDLCKWGGISAVLPIARRVLPSGKRYCPHFLGGGIGLSASGHLLAAVGGDGLLEVDSNANPLRTGLFDPKIERGRIDLGTEPGLGIPPDVFDRFLRDRAGYAVTAEVQMMR